MLTFREMIYKIYYTKIKNFGSAKNNLKKEKNTSLKLGKNIYNIHSQKGPSGKYMITTKDNETIFQMQKI